jgi:hypothetical protein
MPPSRKRKKNEPVATPNIIRLGPEFDVIMSEGHGWGANAINQFVHHDDDPRSFLLRHLDALCRASKANYAMLGMVKNGDVGWYVKMIEGAGACWRLWWLHRNTWASHASNKTLISTIHVSLVDPSNGSSQLCHSYVLRSCGPNVCSLFLHCSTANPFTGAQVLDLIEKCPNLTTLSLSECHVTDALLRGIAVSRCALFLAGLRLSMCKGEMSPVALGSLIKVACPTLVRLNVQLAFFLHGNGKVNHAAWLAPLGRCGRLRVTLLLKVDAALGLLANPASKLKLLSINNKPPTTLSA